MKNKKIDNNLRVYCEDDNQYRNYSIFEKFSEDT